MTIALQARDLTLAAPSGAEIVSGVELALHHGEVTALLGVNGSGKTTLGPASTGQAANSST